MDLIGVASPTDAESPGYLQARFSRFAGILCWAYLLVCAWSVVLYVFYPGMKPARADVVSVIGTVTVIAQLIGWQGVLRRRTLSIRALRAMDVAYAAGTGLLFGTAAFLTPELRITAYMCLFYAYWSVFTRALLVPSTGRWTAIVSSILFAPLLLAAVGLAIIAPQEVPAPAYVVGVILLCVVAVILASTGSRILYGLRRQIRKAMKLGQYTLDRKIGEGGMGAVFLAHHALLRRPTAIKLLLPDRIGADTLARFEREVQHMSQLTHANSVAVFDFGRSADGVFYYAMEYLGGGVDLEKLVRLYGPQPEGRVIRILVQVCRALQEAHNRGIIHRDIKPANIILCERGDEPDVAKVLDYGLVKEIDRETDATGQVIVGTPAYLAPEAVTDPSTVAAAADIYSVGAIGYFLLTGKRVFDGKTAVDICIQHVTATPVPISLVSSAPVRPDIESLLMQCLSKAPHERPRSAADLAQALGALPAAVEWSESSAAEWWRAHRAKGDVSSTGMPTATLMIDLERKG